MKCRSAVPAALAVFALCTIAGCRLGGTSGMTSWLPGQTSTLAGEEELAEAPRFDGEVVKPSTVATPYPTTSTPQGYVVPEAAESVSAPQLAATSPVPATDAAAASTVRTPPVTYGMKPAEVPVVSGAAAPQEPPSQEALAQLTGDSIAPQEGPYAPLAPAGPGGAATPPPNTVASGFAAAGGTSAGPYPPEAAVGLAPAASAASSFSSPPAVQEQAASAFGNRAAVEAAFPRPPAAAQPAVEGRAPFMAEAAAPASAGPTMSAFGQQAAVPEGAASESPVAGARYASAGNSRFGAAPGFDPPAAASGTDLYGMPSTSSDRDLQSAAERPVSSPSSAGADAYASPVEPKGRDPESGTELPASTGFGLQAPRQPAQRPGRRADPMYRPAGTSSYEPAKPFFPDESEGGSRVQMATFEEPAANPFPH